MHASFGASPASRTGDPIAQIASIEPKGRDFPKQGLPACMMAVRGEVGHGLRSIEIRFGPERARTHGADRRDGADAHVFAIPPSSLM